MLRKGFAWLLFSAALLSAAPRRVLFVTTSAGFRHDSIEVSRRVMEGLGARSGGVLEVVSTEDLSLLTAANLRSFDAVFFFTSGELPLSDQQKQDLLAFVRNGGGFGGAHSATDTLYSWPDYGDLIGAYFDGHPWVQQVSIDIEDPLHPAVADLAPSFRIVEETYQFRNFSRDRVRVLMTLDTSTVDLGAPGVNRTDGDFALAWCRNYGQGRVFYSALGHFDTTWLDARIQDMLLNALLWLTGLRPGDATPRSGASAPSPAVFSGGVVNGASFVPAPDNAVAPGSILSLFGANLTSGTVWSNGGNFPLPRKLAGAAVMVNGAPIPLYFVSPGQINAQLPFEIDPGSPASLVVQTPGHGSAPEPLRLDAAAPGIFVALGNSTRAGDPFLIYATGLGPVRPPAGTGVPAPSAPLSQTVTQPIVTVGGIPAAVTFSGLAPNFAGLYQINAVVPAGLQPGPTQVMVQIGDRKSNTVRFPLGP